MAAIECKLAMVINRLVEFEFLTELKFEQQSGTSLHTPRYKDASPSVRGQCICPSQLYIWIFDHTMSETSPTIVIVITIIIAITITVWD
jgi:hypothetical protein